MKEKLNVLFVCGYGVGSSAMSAGIVSRALEAIGIPNEVKHTSAGEASGYADWTDVVAVSKKLVDIVNIDAFPGKDVIEVLNIMDGKTIAGQIMEVVQKKFPEIIKK